MPRSRMSKIAPPFAGLLTALLFSSLTLPLTAQSAKDSHATASVGLAYDKAQEITLAGTVSSVVTKPSAGMMMGSHLLVATSSGTIDASLGRFALLGKNELANSAGQPVAITGVMKDLKGQHVFLARTVKLADQIFTIRNEHGVLVNPHSAERATEKSAEKGASL